MVRATERSGTRPSPRLRSAVFGLLAGIALVVAIACDDITVGTGVSITGSGTPTTRDYDVTGFSAVDISSAFSATVARSAIPSVAVTTDDNVIDEVIVERRGTTLHVGLRSGISLRRVEELAVAIAMPALRSVSVSGASNASLSGFTSERSVEISASGASTVVGDLIAERVEIDLSGASRVEITGLAPQASVKASGGSRVELGGFQVREASVRLDGASTARVSVADTLTSVNVTGASKLTYIGDPDLRNVYTSGASSVDRE